MGNGFNYFKDFICQDNCNNLFLGISKRDYTFFDIFKNNLETWMKCSRNLG